MPGAAMICGLPPVDVGPGQVQHVGGLHVGEAAEHRQQLRQVDEFREARVHAVARAVRREFQRGDRFAEVGGPGVEMLDARAPSAVSGAR